MHENAVRKKLHRFTEETTLIPRGQDETENARRLGIIGRKRGHATNKMPVLTNEADEKVVAKPESSEARRHGRHVPRLGLG